MSIAPPNTQAIRSVNINSSTSTPPHPNEVVYVDIYADSITKDKFILWDDIRVAFHNALHIRHRSRVLPFMKDAEFNALRPFRIAVIPGEVMDIVVSNSQDSISQHQQPSALRRIEQQAARLPKHDPFSTMRPISFTHLSSGQDARFAPPGNYYSRTVNNSSRQQLDDVAFRIHIEELAKQYARDAMSKVAAKMDLDALYAKGDGPPGDFWRALECYLKAVHQSHAHAQVSVGDLFSDGQGVTKDTSVAMVWYFKAAFQGDTNAQRKVEALTLSQLRQTVTPIATTDNRPDSQRHSSNPANVQPINRNNELQIAASTFKGVDQILLNATLGNRYSQVAVGDMYREGKWVPQDYQAAMEWYLKASEQGEPVGQYRVGEFYNNGQGVPQDYAQAMAWYCQSASQGYAPAQYNIALLYYLGRGVDRDYVSAAHWYLMAAHQGHELSQYTIGVRYHRGEGVSQDYSQAMAWFLKAANQGNALAQCNVGSLYDDGRGVPLDYEQAMSWYLKAANQGDALAQFMVGSLYDDGQGVPQDYEQAMFWYLKAANQGDAQSQNNVGLLYFHGRGVPQDEAQAAEMFLMAAKQGFAISQYIIGSLYSNGLGVPQDYARAVEWYQMAADQGHIEAKIALKNMRKSGRIVG